MELFENGEQEKQSQDGWVLLNVKTLKDVIEHIQKKAMSRVDTLSDETIEKFRKWAQSKPYVPGEKWCIDFGEFTLAGEEGIAKTILSPGMICKGISVKI